MRSMTTIWTTLRPTKAVSDFEQPSKSQLKRERRAIHDLARQLTEIPNKSLAALPIEADLRQEIRAAKNMSKGALQRQLRFIGGRLAEADVPAVQVALEEILRPQRTETTQFHEVEYWRDRIVNEGDPAVTALIERFPAGDSQHLRRLARNAKREQMLDQPPRAARQLFSALRDLLNAGDQSAD